MSNDNHKTKPSADKIFEGLNKEQSQSVSHKNGPLLVIAGAGTGKTTVVTRRIANIIDKKWAKPSQILALTFTEKAAAEMEERVDQLVPYGYTDMWISTFHAFCDRLLRDYSIDLGLSTNFKVLSKTQQIIFFRQNLHAFDLNYFRPPANPYTHIEAMLTHFSRLKDELITPNTYHDWANNNLKNKKSNEDTEENSEIQKYLELADAYQRYQELMMQAGNLDFGDQIYLTYKLLKENKAILEECQKQFLYILVDEYQDTNYAQNEIVKLLASKNKNITVVGDDDQSIYRFRGASISNILDFRKTYKNCQQIVLTKNYRSTQEILDSSYNLIQYNNPDRLEIQNKINKKLTSKKAGERPSLIYADTLSDETDSVADKIIQLKKTNKFKYSDFAILIRANNQAESFIQALNKRSIPSIFSGSSSLFSTNEIKLLISFFRCLVRDDDNLSFFNLATSDIYNIPISVMTKYFSMANKYNRTISEIYNKTEKTQLFSELDPVINDINKYQKRIKDPAGEVLYDYLVEKKYLKSLIKNESIENESKLFNIAKFFDKITEFNHSTDNRSVINFLENLELMIKAGDDTPLAEVTSDVEAVNIMTVHSSKGLEWPVVFIVNCVADKFPSKKFREQLPIPEELIKERLPEGDFHLQEERRLFYVAATRAQKYLYLSAAKDYGGVRSKKLSPFAHELLSNLNSTTKISNLSPMEKIIRHKRGELLNNQLDNIAPNDIINLSRAQIDDYYTCPKKYFYAHIVKIPLLENQNLMYGTAIHSALDHYFRRKIAKKKPTLQNLLADFESSFKNVGFICREDEDRRYNDGKTSLKRFFYHDQKYPITPMSVESRFEFYCGNAKISGRYDLIAKDNNDILVLDFKTSSVRSDKDALRRVKESTQMKIYALSYFEKCKHLPKTALYFIEHNLIGEIIFSEKQLVKMKEIILKVEKGIRSMNFLATPNKRQCSICPYLDICPDSKK